MPNRWEQFTDKELQALKECLATAVDFQKIVTGVLFNRSVAATHSGRLFREVADEMARRLRLCYETKPRNALEL